MSADGVDQMAKLKKRQLEAVIAKTERIRNPQKTAPAGYRYTSQGRLEPIEGGPVSRTIQEQERQRQLEEEAERQKMVLLDLESFPIENM